MSRRIPALALTVIAAMVPLAGCGDDEDSGGGGEPAAESGSAYGGGDTQPAEGTDGGGDAAATEAASVEIAEFAYDPVSVKVSAGGTIEWTNSDSAPHTATAEDDSFDTGSLDKGDSAKVTFDEPGTFKYICTFHPFMNATVEVVE